MANYKSFRLVKRAPGEQQQGRGDVSTVLQAKRYMTSAKAAYFPPTPTHAPSPESVLAGLRLQFEQLCTAAAAAGGQLFDVSRLHEGWGNAILEGKVRLPNEMSTTPVLAAGAAVEKERLPLPPAVVGAAGPPLVCRVVFSQPEVSDLRPAPFKQLGLWESDNGVNVPKKLLEWKKHGGLFGGKDEFLPPTVCVCCNAKQPAAVLSCLCGAEPHDFIEVVESAFKLGSWRTVLQQRPDIAAYISELALVDYKNSIMATVRSVALNDPEVEKWWATFLTHKIRSRVGYVVGKETPMFSWPRKFRAGSLSPTTSQNVAPRDGGAGGYENCSSTASIVASHTLPVMVQTLSFSGHGKSFISNRLAEHGLRDAASVRRGERLATTPPDLAKTTVVCFTLDKCVKSGRALINLVGKVWGICGVARFRRCRFGGCTGRRRVTTTPTSLF